MSLKSKLLKSKDKEVGLTFKTYLQSYLAWLSLQNPSFAQYLTDEELVNYFFNELELPYDIQMYNKRNSFNILSKTYEYISRYKDKTSMFQIKVNIIPIKKGNYKGGDRHD